MFKKDFQPGSRSKVKSSVQRGLRSKLIETYPGFEPYIDEIMPKKASLEAVKLVTDKREKGRIELPYTQSTQPLSSTNPSTALQSLTSN
uniref:Translation machinery-associated protein 20 n=1 Tax=Talaromyces marneffei PM1 TaxID=1077442 RepID=A0A093V0N9_TALMA